MPLQLLFAVCVVAGLVEWAIALMSVVLTATILATSSARGG